MECCTVSLIASVRGVFLESILLSSNFDVCVFFKPFSVSFPLFNRCVPQNADCYSQFAPVLIDMVNEVDIFHRVLSAIMAGRETVIGLCVLALCKLVPVFIYIKATFHSINWTVLFIFSMMLISPYLLHRKTHLIVLPISVITFVRNFSIRINSIIVDLITELIVLL